MTWKIYLAAGLVAIAALGAGYGLWQRSEVTRLHTYAQALENRVAGLQSSERAIRSAAEAADSARRAAQDRANATQRKLDEALKAAPGWADQPVPDGVWGALKP